VGQREAVAGERARFIHPAHRLSIAGRDLPSVPADYQK